jgi:hypothetical protein
MEALAKKLDELIELQKASIRLQKFAIVLQAEAMVYRNWAATGGKPSPGIEKRCMKTVRQMRATVDRIEAGRKLPK